MNILVTGSEGFVSSHLIPKLQKLKHNVSTMDIKAIGDVRSKIQCNDFTRGIDCVIHLAALTDVQESVEGFKTGNFDYYQTNLTGTVNMLNACVHNGVKRFVFASSAAADSPQSPYGVTKLCGEQWCDVFQKCYGLSTISLRFFNIYGKGTEKGVIPTWIKAIKKGERPIIYGGDQIRDFVYIEDIVRAIICATECDATGMYEVGAGLGIRIFDLAFVVLEAMKSKLKIIPEERKDGEIDISIAKNVGRSLDYLGWKPKYQLVEQGLREMLK